MQSLKLLAALLLVSPWLTAQNPEKNINSIITEVTVFQQGAQVTRGGSAQIPEGHSAVVFKSLPQGMDPNSIQLGGSGDVTVLSISHRNNYLNEEEISEELKSLKTRIDDLEMDIRKLRAEEDGLKKEKELIVANQKITGENASLDFEQLQKIAAFTSSRITAINIKIEEIRVEIQKLEKEKNKLVNQMNVDRQRFTSKPGEVVVSLESQRAQNVNLELTYIVGGVSWASAYDARVNDLSQPVQLTHKARITQTTGEDWKDVKLTLATGNPSAGAQVPYMGVWYVNFNNVNYGNQLKRLDSRNANTIAMDEAEVLERAPGVMSDQQFQVSQNLTQQEYSIERKQTILSSNSPVTVVLRDVELPAKYEYHAKPRLDPDAFLVAKVYDWGKFDLLDGELSLFNNNTYVGKSVLNTSNPDDTLQLSLGRDKGVVVKRTRVYSKQTKTIFGNNQVDHYVWKIELRNNKKTAVDVVLRDQVPVSQHEEIKVTVNSVGGGNYDEKTGIIKWRLSLSPGQTQSYEVSYEVKYPKGSSQGVRYY